MDESFLELAAYLRLLRWECRLGPSAADRLRLIEALPEPLAEAIRGALRAAQPAGVGPEPLAIAAIEQAARLPDYLKAAVAAVVHDLAAEGERVASVIAGLRLPGYNRAQVASKVEMLLREPLELTPERFHFLGELLDGLHRGRKVRGLIRRGWWPGAAGETRPGEAPPPPVLVRRGQISVPTLAILVIRAEEGDPEARAAISALSDRRGRPRRPLARLIAILPWIGPLVAPRRPAAWGRDDDDAVPPVRRRHRWTAALAAGIATIVNPLLYAAARTWLVTDPPWGGPSEWRDVLILSAAVAFVAYLFLAAAIGLLSGPAPAAAGPSSPPRPIELAPAPSPPAIATGRRLPNFLEARRLPTRERGNGIH